MKKTARTHDEWRREIRRYISDNPGSTIKEIRDAYGTRSTKVDMAIKELRAEGYITWESFMHRAYYYPGAAEYIDRFIYS